MTKNNAVEKIFAEIESLISALLQEATDHTNDWKKNTEHPIRKEIEGRLEDLFTNEGKTLPYSFYELKEMLSGVIDGLPELVDKEGKINKNQLDLLTNFWAAAKKIKSEIGDKKEQTIPTIEEFYEFLKEKEEFKNKSVSEKEAIKAERENMTKKSELEKLLKEILEQLTKENIQQKQWITDLKRRLEGILTGKDPADTESEAKKKIRTELDKFKNIKIEEISDEECFDLFDTFETLKNWVFSDNEEESEASMSKKSELKEITNKLDLEAHRREWKQDINSALKDEDEEEEERIVLKNTDLTEIDYIEFEKVLRKKTSEKEIDSFGRKVIRDVEEQRQKHENIINVLDEGEEALKKKDIEWANNVLLYLQFLENLPGAKERQVFRSNKIVEINRLKKNIDSLSQQAQIIQNPKKG